MPARSATCRGILLAAKCLAQNGVRILIHGGGAHTAGRLYSEQLLEALQIPAVPKLAAGRRGVRATASLAFMPLVRLGTAAATDDRLAQHPGPALADPLAGAAFSTRWVPAAACKASFIPVTRRCTAMPAACSAIPRL